MNLLQSGYPIQEQILELIAESDGTGSGKRVDPCVGGHEHHYFIGSTKFSRRMEFSKQLQPSGV
jgi:hypothetical protein